MTRVLDQKISSLPEGAHRGCLPRQLGFQHRGLSPQDRDLLFMAFEELDVRNACGLLIFARESEHVVGHVEAIRKAGRSDAAGRE